MLIVITKSELATQLGVSRPRVSQLIQLGLPVRTDGRIDYEAALGWLQANGRRTVNFPDRGVNLVMDAAAPAEAPAAAPAEGTGMSYNEARALREGYQAKTRAAGIRDQVWPHAGRGCG